MASVSSPFSRLTDASFRAARAASSTGDDTTPMPTTTATTATATTVTTTATATTAAAVMPRGATIKSIRSGNKFKSPSFHFNQIIKLSSDRRLWSIVMSPSMHAQWLEWKAQYRATCSKTIPFEKNLIPTVVTSPDQVAGYEHDFREWLVRTRPNKADCRDAAGCFDVSRERNFRLLYATQRAEYGHPGAIRVSLELLQAKQAQQAQRAQQASLGDAHEQPMEQTGKPSIESRVQSAPTQTQTQTTSMQPLQSDATSATHGSTRHVQVPSTTGGGASAKFSGISSCCPCATKWLDKIQTQVAESMHRLATIEKQQQAWQQQKREEQHNTDHHPQVSPRNTKQLLATLLQRVDELEKEKEFLYQRLDWERDWRKRAEARLEHLEQVHDVCSVVRRGVLP